MTESKSRWANVRHEMKRRAFSSSTSTFVSFHLVLKRQNEMRKIENLLFFIEMTFVSEYFYNWKQVEEMKSRVIELSGLEMNLTGRKSRQSSLSK